MSEQEIIDCHYCDFACTDSPDSSRVDCYVEDWGYFDHHVKDTKKEAEDCEWFHYCASFPKW